MFTSLFLLFKHRVLSKQHFKPRRQHHEIERKKQQNFGQDFEQFCAYYSAYRHPYCNGDEHGEIKRRAVSDNACNRERKHHGDSGCVCFFAGKPTRENKQRYGEHPSSRTEKSVHRADCQSEENEQKQLEYFRPFRHVFHLL